MAAFPDLGDLPMDLSSLSGPVLGRQASLDDAVQSLGLQRSDSSDARADTANNGADGEPDDGANDGAHTSPAPVSQW